MSEKLYKVIAKILDVPISEINDESSPETIENWDSFNSLVLADELESEFNVSFSLEEIIDSANVSAIKKHLKNHGVSLDD
ncbi:MAG: acyl carrier protein [Chloroflexi bacterium]|jgi:acyl carrier protein|nr:acyl carrier protein [Chloroflexota bacterium]|tara:strand:+ start:3328 stop:3567 length:240 start_codon:yes stop_codon:yes gene_type:complete